MKKPILMFLIVFFLSAPAYAGDADFLTGDAKLACEAILCLSSSTRPGECAPSITKYFSIKSNAKKNRWSKTKEMRKNFLNQCPSASHDKNMESLVGTLTNLGGQCDAAHLNSLGKWRTEKRTRSGQCSNSDQAIDKWNYQVSYKTRSERVEYGSSERPRYKTVYYCDETTRFLDVPKSPPSECLNLWNHVNTDYSQRPHLNKGQSNKDIVWQD